MNFRKNHNIMAKSRFTKYFYFLSTVFVDKFVDNEQINQLNFRFRVYDLLKVNYRQIYLSI